jgi:hypothetical protein
MPVNHIVGHGTEVIGSTPEAFPVVACGFNATLRCMSDVTRILEAAQQGDPKAAEELLPLVYEELRRLAAHRMANEAAGQTLQPTALVHEAWLRLVGNENQKWDTSSPPPPRRCAAFSLTAPAANAPSVMAVINSAWIFKKWIWLQPPMTTNFWP